MLGRPKRQLPPPEVIKDHHSDNPMFPSPASPEIIQFRRRVLVATATGMAAMVLGLVIYGPWLSVTDVTVAGTKVLNPASIKNATSKYLQGRQWLIFPRRNLWLASSHDLGTYLIKKISQRLSIESVSVTKIFPHQLTVTVVERTPLFLWMNSQGLGSLDRQGVLIEIRDRPDPTLAIVHDQFDGPLQPDQHVLAPEVVKKIREVQKALQATPLVVKEFIIPKPTCPLPPPPAETISSVNVNSNGTNININDNINTTPIEVNVNTNAPMALPPCDLLDLRYHSQEIHVQLDKGQLVLFDRHQNLALAVATLQRVLAQPENAHATYVDVRFQERVFIK